MINIQSIEWPPKADDVSLDKETLITLLSSEDAEEKIKSLGSVCGHLFQGNGILPLRSDAILSVLESQISTVVTETPDMQLGESFARDAFASTYIVAQNA